MSSKAADLDAIALSALMSSRICHDLINPVGALSSGLEVLADPGMDEGMKEAAIDLIQKSAGKSVALLKYARLAYGASGGLGAELPLEEAKHVLDGIFEWTKATLDWRLAPGQAPKDEVRALLILAYAAADCVPRGGEVVVEGATGAYSIRVSGARLIVQDDFATALGGDVEDIKAKFTPHYLAGMMARQGGGGVDLAQTEQEMTINLRFFAASSQTEPDVLTAS